MWLHVCKAKIHRVRITELDLDYEGSISVDEELLDAAKIIPYEKVQVLNINNGERAETYIIPAKRRSGTIGLNGALARLAQKGDHLILITYCMIPEDEATAHRPKIVLVDNQNHITSVIGG